MKIFENIFCTTKPPRIEIKDNKIFLALNIQEIERSTEGTTESCYSYTLIEYDKDEYLVTLIKNQLELNALKILFEWNNNKTYQIGDRVYLNDKIYESTVANNIFSPVDYSSGWKELTN